MRQPEWFQIKGKEDMVCKLKKSIYGLKQSPRCLIQALDKYLKQMGFKQSTKNSSIYTLNSGGEVFIIAVFVDDFILRGESASMIQQ